MEICIIVEIWKLPCFEVEVPETCLTLWKERYYKYYIPEMTEAMKCGAPKSEARNAAANDVIKKYKQVIYPIPPLSFSFNFASES